MKKELALLLLIFIFALVACNSSVKKTTEQTNHVDTSSKVQQSDESIKIDEPYSSSGTDTSTTTPVPIKERLTQKNTKIVFPMYVVNLHNYKVYSNLNGRGDLGYDGDTSEVKLNITENNIWTVVSKRDSLHLEEDPDNSFGSNLIEIMPKNSLDIFKVYYSFQVSLKFRNANIPFWQGVTMPRQLKDSLNYFFKVPKHAYNDCGEKEIKKTLKLKDTLVTYSGEFEERATLIYNKKPCIYNAERIRLRIDRLSGNKFKESKFIIITFDRSG